MAPQSDTVTKITGVVIEALPNTQFRVQLEDEKLILAHLAGRMRLHRIRVMPGDQVVVELTPYDDSKGRIVYRNK
jgi:translation initiation factor IF-1